MLQVGIKAISVLSEPKPGKLPVVFVWYIELPSILVVLCCVVLLLFLPVGWFCYSSEMAGGNGRNDDAIAAALTTVAQVLAQAQGIGGHG